MRCRLTIVACIAFAVCLGGAPVFGQDTGQVAQAVERIEVGLTQLIQQEAANRNEQIAQLRATIEQMDSSATDQTGVSEEDLAGVMAELIVLKTEVQNLKRALKEDARQLASIDDEGFYVPPETSPEIVEINERLYILSTSLENILSGLTVAAEPNPSVNHGKVAISGMVHEHFVSAPDETSTFVSKRARLTFKGEINDYAQIKIQGEFAKTPQLLDGQVTISPNSQWSLSMGQYKPPFGTDFLIPATATPFVNRSMAAGLGTDRDIGATVSFRHEFSPDYSLKLITGLFNGSGINTTDVNNHKNFVARVETTMSGMFTLSPNVLFGKTNEVDSLKQNLTDLGGSVTWAWHREILEAEYVYSKRGDAEQNGWYVWGGHSLDIGLSFLQQVQLLARYEQYDPDTDIHDDRADRLTVGVNLFVDKKYTKIQLNYLVNSEQGELVNNNEFLVNVQVAF